VQQVQYSEGSYAKAAALAEGEESSVLDFISSALNSPDGYIQNAGDQTVVWDSNGITTTDPSHQSQKVRIANGSISFHTVDENGVERWSAAITASGISANQINAG
jgi:hypothetical protein